MASLNLSSNGPSITASYNKIVNAPAPSGPAASSPTYGQWAVFTVQAPLVSAFQQDGGKESVLKVQTTGEGELIDMIEEFSDGRIQFAFVKVRDPNSGLPKNVLIGWCGEGVPERTKGYFTSHSNAVSKVLHGYHVQVTARSDRDLTPELIVQKVADSSGSKYSGGGAPASSSGSGPAPPVASKPTMPTKSFGAAGGFQPLGARSRGAPGASGGMDQDGWGEDAPPVTRSQLEKVESAYKPTKVNLAALQSQREPSRYQAPEPTSNGSDVVRGGYQPIGKVDINALRKQAQGQGSSQDDRPTVVKGSYEPVGKVDINEIRRKAQAAPAPTPVSTPAQPAGDEDDRPKSLSERSAAFTSSQPLTSMPKPKVTNRFGSSTSSFTGTKAPTPSSFDSKPSVPAPIGAPSRSFAESAGKTPAQIWAEKKARERGNSGAADTQAPPPGAAPIQSQPSGSWQSSYGGKKWGVQLPTRTGGSGVSEQRTGQQDEPVDEENDQPAAGGIGNIRDRFNAAPPMGAPREAPASAPEPPPLDTSSKPNAGVRGVPMPGLPQRPVPQEEEEEEEERDMPAEQHQTLPPPPPRPQPADEEDEADPDTDIPQGSGSPVRIAMPVSRGQVPQPIEPMNDANEPPAMPTRSLEKAISHTDVDEPEPQVEEDDPARAAGHAAANTTFGGAAQDHHAAETDGGKEAIAQYDYEKAEDNELELHEGERIINIEMVDEDWWMGENTRGERGLFPSNYVELTESTGGASGAPSAPPAREPEPEYEEEPASTPHAPAAPAAPAAPSGGAHGGATAKAEYEYEAAEENELSFPEGATVTGIEFPDEDWWFGHYGGKSGLFPANYVTLDE